MTIALVCVALAALATPAQASRGSGAGSTGVMLPAYAPGAANAFKPVYDPITGKIQFKCNYTGWRSGPGAPTVTWQCNLRNIAGIMISPHNGTFGGGSYSTPYFYHPPSIGKVYCTEAFGYSADGGDSDLKCQ